MVCIVFSKRLLNIPQITAKYCLTITLKYWLKTHHRQFAVKLHVENHYVFSCFKVRSGIQMNVP